MELLLEEVKTNVQQKFNEVRAALHMREKLLLRQLEVIANTHQQQSAPVYIDYESHKEQEKCEKCAIRFVTGDKNEEEKLLLAIRSFGQFQLDSNMQLALHRAQDNRNAGLRNEDYIEPVDDHETMYKCLEDRASSVAYYDLNDEVQPEAIVVDFSRNKALLEDNAKRSIINITLQEAKDLIRRAKVKRETFVPPLNLEELDDELESSIADAVSSLGRSSVCPEQAGGKPKPKQRKPRFKPKITINNCNGTINLRNIASLTINCASEEAVSAELPLAEAPATASAAAAAATQSADSSTTTTDPSSCTPSSSNYSSNASSRSQSKKHKETKAKAKSIESTPTTDNHEATCDFYNRLLNEIKKSLKQKPSTGVATAGVEATTTTTTTATVTSSDAAVQVQVDADSSCDAGDRPVHVTSSESAISSSSQLQPGKRLVLKNFENLKIILEANSGDEDAFHPVQIEQWLAEIISETDLEPMQNTDILEHSKINTSESN
ncbi:uncharacterized protein LOC6556656 [Drosophila grimshawi]|uniref:GH15395 n=1 Tax=Drosophila grimshawi TaxID=7222 RepID=B4J343_DROGR|nr:uncharacterized protein LOC6556656 [Drosophila grimshawi]EDV96114.1 GH15395 [Drosophila grimshawi]